MDDSKKCALDLHHQRLRTGILVENFLPALRLQLQLTDVEYSRIASRKCNVEMVDELMAILCTKENEHFDGFCAALRNNNYTAWADRLEHSSQGITNTETSQEGPVHQGATAEMQGSLLSVPLSHHHELHQNRPRATMDLPPSQDCSENGKEGSEYVIGVSQVKAFGEQGAIALPGRDVTRLHLPGLQYSYQRLSCIGQELIKQYRHCRQLLGNNVEEAHKHWREMMTFDNIDPPIKACVLSFSVISTPTTTAYLRHHWHDLWLQMAKDRNGGGTLHYEMARFMVQYALAWAMWTQDLDTAIAKVKACYYDMNKLNLMDTFILAPYYTVTIGRWIYKSNRHNLFSVIAEIEEYAEETFRLIATLKDDWARIDAFGAKLSALHLLILVANYLHQQSPPFKNAFIRLHSRIKYLHGIISQELSDKLPRIVLYDQAWFHNVNATYYLLASTTATTEKDKVCSCALAKIHASQSADLYYRNGRYWRAREEAERSGDPHKIREYSKLLQDAPGV